MLKFSPIFCSFFLYWSVYIFLYKSYWFIRTLYLWQVLAFWHICCKYFFPRLPLFFELLCMVGTIKTKVLVFCNEIYQFCSFWFLSILYVFEVLSHPKVRESLYFLMFSVFTLLESIRKLSWWMENFVLLNHGEWQQQQKE